jgi:hypothetical protein
MIASTFFFAIADGVGMSRKSSPRGTARIIRGLMVFGSLLALALPAVARAECPNEQLRQSAGVSNIDPATGQPYDASLPDCRAFEQVSPTEKDGGRGGVYALNSPAQIFNQPPLPLRSLAAGSEITYPGEPFYHVESKTLEEIEHELRTGGSSREQYTSVRTSGGWSTRSGNLLSAEEAPEEAPIPILPLVASGGPRPEVFEETPDGSKVFFTDEKNLTLTSTTGAGEPDLYEYTAPTPARPEGELVDLTVDQNGGQHADVQGVLGVGGEGAEEGSFVYFVAAGTLAPGPLTTGGGCITERGTTEGTDCNLYLRHDGDTRFIATLSGADEDLTGGLGVALVDWAGPGSRTAEVSPNGRYLAFGSNLPLTKQNAAPEIFRYDAMAEERHERPIECVSCGSTLCGSCGTLPVVSTEAGINGTGKQRYMLNDGRVLFNTSAPLVPDDTNRQNDVYEWEPPAVGDCNTSSGRFSQVSGGCVGLISGGTSEVDVSLFADASASGDDIFFTTRESLIPQDQDEVADMYDAREGGGFPPSESGPACAPGAACPGVLATPPTLSEPASAAISGIEGIPVKSIEKPKPLTQAQKLAKALKACHAKRGRKIRVACEGAARKAYGPRSQPKKTKKRKRG